MLKRTMKIFDDDKIRKELATVLEGIASNTKIVEMDNYPSLQFYIYK